MTGLGLMINSFKKLVNRLSHGNGGEFAGIIGGSSDTAKLEIPLSVVRAGMQ